MPNNFIIGIKRARGYWTPEKVQLAVDMASAGETTVKIATAVGMSTSAVDAKVAGVDRPRRRAPKTTAAHHYVGSVERAPKQILEERERRAAAADLRNYTQTFFGDPPPGFSAACGKTGMT